MEFVIGDVKDAASISGACRGVDIAVHAAAMKHVGVTERNPFECLKTNIVGSQNLIEAALHHRVGQVVALSTDKAVNPIGAYGASKLGLEVLFLDADRRHGDDCRFTVVRYGNIFGSKGSVVPLFLKLKNQGFLPITDPAATRFSISMMDSIDLVMFALEHGWGGEIVLPRCPSYKLLDLANAVDPQVEKRTVGLRPGEKLHELLYSSAEASRVLCRERVFVVAPQAGRWTTAAYREKELSSRIESESELSSDKNTHWLDVPALRSLVLAHANGKSPMPLAPLG
jgi:FlaA1/EpsC-like NDP-sugar epimerase